MPQITIRGKTIAGATGANLRQVSLAEGIDPYNGNAKLINCRGMGL